MNRRERYAVLSPIFVVALGIFCVFLVFDLCWVAGHVTDSYRQDEWRYFYYADNLLHGYFSPRGRVFLWNGPGYPVVLMPFAKLGWVDGARYANAVWHAAALSCAWLILRARLSARWALAGVAVLCVYVPAYEYLPLAQTEIFCFFLCTIWIHFTVRFARSRMHRLFAGIVLALLCLTKVVFGAVVMLSLVPLLLLRLLRRSDRYWRAALQQTVLALILCAPYLAYTHNLTGRWLYWSSAGPNSFYWLTSPYANEWGDWYHHGWVYSHPTLRAHHKAIMDETGGLTNDPSLSFEEQLFNGSTPEAADIFLRAGMRNLRQRPVKFARNWCGNLVRLFLDVPTSVRGTRFLNVYSAVHLPLLAWTAFVLGAARRRRVLPPREWRPLGLFFLLVLGSYSFSSATARFMIPLVPLWWLGTSVWFAVIANADRDGAIR